MTLKRVRKRTKSLSEIQAHEEAFQLILARFDTVDKDNKEINDSLKTHVADDLKVHATVSTHSTYWALLIGLGTPAVLGMVAWFNGLFHR